MQKKVISNYVADPMMAKFLSNGNKRTLDAPDGKNIKKSRPYLIKI
jgi:hypothetical protein